MSFLQREYDKLNAALNDAVGDHDRYLQLYAAQQAISWAIDPNAVASPYAFIMDKRDDNSVNIVWTDGPQAQAA